MKEHKPALGREPRLSPSGLEARPPPPPRPAPALVVTGPGHVPCLRDAPSPRPHYSDEDPGSGGHTGDPDWGSGGSL